MKKRNNEKLIIVDLCLFVVVALVMTTILIYAAILETNAINSLILYFLSIILIISALIAVETMKSRLNEIFK